MGSFFAKYLRDEPFGTEEARQVVGKEMDELLSLLVNVTVQQLDDSAGAQDAPMATSSQNNVRKESISAPRRRFSTTNPLSEGSASLLSMLTQTYPDEMMFDLCERTICAFMKYKLS